MTKPRGIALFLVLITTAIVVALVGFFVAVNEQNLQNYKVQMSQTRALQAAQSGFSYVRYLLEKDRTWAFDRFQPSDPPLPYVNGLNASPVSNTRTIKGELLDSQGQPTGESFEALILNNSAQLGVSAPKDFSEGFVGGKVTMTLPGDTVLVRIQGRCGSFQKTVEVNLVGGPLYDSAATSLNAVDLSGNSKLTVASKDIMRNWLRSNKNITFQDFVNSPSTVKFEFRDQNGAPLTTNSPSRSMIWAKGDINLLDKAVGSPTSDPSGQLLAAASQKSGAILTPRSSLNRQIYDLKLEDLKQPSENPPYVLPGGAFDFAIRKFEAKYTYSVPSPDGDIPKDAKTIAYVPYLTWTDKSGNEMAWYDNSQSAIYPAGIPEDAKNVKLEKITNDKDQDVGQALPGINVSPKSTLQVPTSESPLAFKFDGLAFELDGTRALKIDGDFHIGAPKYGKSTGNLQTSLQRPTIKFSSDAGQAPAFLYSDNGNIEIQGTVKGRGGIAAAKGNVSVYAGTATNLQAGTKDSLVLYSGKDVTLNADANSNINFRGLIYGDRNINFTALNPDGSKGTLNRLSVEGAVVARSGNLDLKQSQDLDLTYNPAYLTQFTKGLRKNRNSLKVTNWRVL